MKTATGKRDWVHYYFKSTSGVIGLFLVLVMVILSLI
ncbi:MAG: hypothetical protein RL057_548, partial [Actinomycetota bacterium]